MSIAINLASFGDFINETCFETRYYRLPFDHSCGVVSFELQTLLYAN